MGAKYIIFFVSTIVIFLINFLWLGINLVYWATNGLQNLLDGMNFIESIYYSTYLRWIIVLDISWILGIICTIAIRKNYNTNSDVYYLNTKQIHEPKIAVILPTFNEELAIEKVIKDFQTRDNVSYIFVIDNNSNDKTVEIAKRNNAKVIEKEVNRGYPHSCVLGFKEALKTDATVIALAESDGTYSGNDLAKMISYLQHCDMVVGSRQVQALSEKGNQNSTLYIWGNYILAKLLQLRYFSVSHLSSIQLTDVGCSFRMLKRESLEKIIEKFTYPGTDDVLVSSKSGLFALFTTMLFIENKLRVVEIPITFRKRIGFSKTKSDKKINGLRYFILFMWFIVSK